MKDSIRALKTKHLNQVADYTEQLYHHPKLRRLFLELTLACNAHCFHCGSNCTPQSGADLTLEDYKWILAQIKEDFDISRLQLCITGGEPMLRPDFFDIMAAARDLGFRWGMTSNGTLITKEAAHKLAECGMETISISVDGLPRTHDRLRGMLGGYKRTMAGIQNLIDEGAFKTIQVTTVINHRNIEELDAMFEIMDKIDIDSWRVINLEPMGRARQHPELMCTKEDYHRLLDFIRDKRAAGYPLEYGCAHYLGLDYEVEVREWYWLCSAGVYTASIMANGDIAACLDIERRPETIMGNIRTDRFKDVWENRFEIFRQNPSKMNATCHECEHERFCRGDSWHSWNFDENKPMVCYKEIL